MPDVISSERPVRFFIERRVLTSVFRTSRDLEGIRRGILDTILKGDGSIDTLSCSELYKN